MDISFRSRSFVLICLFMINQYVLCLENNPSSSLNEVRLFPEKSSSSSLSDDTLRNSRLFIYLMKKLLNRDTDDYENPLFERTGPQLVFANNDLNSGLKRTANKGWNKLNGLIGKRSSYEQQLNDDQNLLGLSNDLGNNNGMIRNLRANTNQWNKLNGVWGKRDDPLKKQHQKSWNQLGDVWG